MPSHTSSTKIFISYRHAESALHARLLSEQLKAHFGTKVVFIDTENIQLGRDYVEAIEEEIRSCKIFLAVIGQQWLTCSNENGRRLDDPHDEVRRELKEVLRQRRWLIPVLVQGASMPRESDLPEELAPLARKQACRVDEAHWTQDVRNLIERIEDIMPAHPVEPRKVFAAIGALIFLAAVLVVASQRSSDGVIDNASDIQQAINIGTCKHECNRFTCPIKNNLANKITAVEVELAVELPNADPSLKTTYVSLTLELDRKSSGEPEKTSSYSAPLDDYAEGTTPSLNRVIRVVVRKNNSFTNERTNVPARRRENVVRTVTVDKSRRV